MLTDAKGDHTMAPPARRRTPGPPRPGASRLGAGLLLTVAVAGCSTRTAVRGTPPPSTSPGVPASATDTAASGAPNSAADDSAPVNSYAQDSAPPATAEVLADSPLGPPSAVAEPTNPGFGNSLIFSAAIAPGWKPCYGAGPPRGNDIPVITVTATPADCNPGIAPIPTPVLYFYGTSADDGADHCANAGGMTDATALAVPDQVVAKVTKAGSPDVAAVAGSYSYDNVTLYEDGFCFGGGISGGYYFRFALDAGTPAALAGALPTLWAEITNATLITVPGP